LARAYFLNYEYRRSVTVSEVVLEAAERADLPEILADTLVTKGSALAGLGRPQEGEGVIKIGEQIAQTHGFAMTQLRAIRNRSTTLDAGATIVRELANETLALARRLGDRNTALDSLQTLGWCAALFDGDAESALSVWADALEDDLEPADRIPILGPSLILRAWRGESVADGLAELQGLASTLSEPGFRSTHGTRGWVAFGTGNIREAENEWMAQLEATTAAWDEALFVPWAARAALWEGEEARVRAYLTRLDGLGAHSPAADLRRLTVSAGLAAIEGATADALELYETALRGWRDLGHAWEEAFTGIDMATVLDPSLPEVRAAADSSRQFFRRFGASGFIDRLEALLGRSDIGRAGVPEAIPRGVELQAVDGDRG
jgi:hypothetical protein